MAGTPPANGAPTPGAMVVAIEAMVAASLGRTKKEKAKEEARRAIAMCATTAASVATGSGNAL